MSPGLNIEDDVAGAMRSELMPVLPRLLSKAILDYSRFTTGSPPDDAKGFVAYQTGCKAALAHIHLLVKLVQWALATNEDDITANEAEHLERLVRDAETALQCEDYEGD
jgi:hypothetical protein